MGIIKKHPPVKLITAIACCPAINFKSVIEEIEKLYSSVDQESDIYNFSNYTTYYQTEMGTELKKCFLSFLGLINPEDLPSVKIKTNELEKKYCNAEKRQVNIDPGYISQAKIILATTKNYNHRIYLGQGVFGDVHLHYHHKSFQPQDWTYPDYKRQESIHFFNTVRQKYLQQLAEIKS